MKIGNSHLTYCTNIYPGDRLEDLWRNVFFHCPEVKRHISPDNPMGVGIWMSDRASKALLDNLNEFKESLKEADLYVFTVNAFPFGSFHGERVKEAVYQPDWSSRMRLEYTQNVAFILSQLLPYGVTGSISTVPVSYGRLLSQESIENIRSMAVELRDLRDMHNRHIRLAFEPEPDCYLQNTSDCISFFKILREKIGSSLVDDYLGICLDTCHFIIENQSLESVLDVLNMEQIHISKIQLSSALTFDHTPSNDLRFLLPFQDSVYLHQTCVIDENKIKRFSDLSEALEEKPLGKWFIHYHTPLHFIPSHNGIGTTASSLDVQFLRKAFSHTEHIEIETYTFDVLPDKTEDVNDSIVKELQFVIERIA